MSPVTINGYFFWSGVGFLCMLLIFLLAQYVLEFVRSKRTHGDVEEGIIGQTGMVIRPVQPGTIGRIHFRKAWRGQTDWDVVSAHQIRIGGIARVVKCDQEHLVIERFVD